MTLGRNSKKSVIHHLSYICKIVVLLTLNFLKVNSQFKLKIGLKELLLLGWLIAYSQ